jgi:hypothetical protein
MNGDSSRLIRWLPALAAALGLVGGIGGAYIGGLVANEGQETQFRNQRVAQIQDLLVGTYGRYLRTAEKVAANYTTLKEVRAEDEKAADFAAFAAAEAELHLVASRDLLAAAEAVRKSLRSQRAYRTARDAFAVRANNVINALND